MHERVPIQKLSRHYAAMPIAVFCGVVAGLVTMFADCSWMSVDLGHGHAHDPVDGLDLAFVVGPLVSLVVVAIYELPRAARNRAHRHGRTQPADGRSPYDASARS
jgi:hypothetical protein